MIGKQSATIEKGKCHFGLDPLTGKFYSFKIKDVQIFCVAIFRGEEKCTKRGSELVVVLPFRLKKGLQLEINKVKAAGLPFIKKSAVQG